MFAHHIQGIKPKFAQIVNPWMPSTNTQCIVNARPIQRWSHQVMEQTPERMTWSTLISIRPITVSPPYVCIWYLFAVMVPRLCNFVVPAEDSKHHYLSLSVYVQAAILYIRSVPAIGRSRHCRFLDDMRTDVLKTCIPFMKFVKN